VRAQERHAQRPLLGYAYAEGRAGFDDPRRDDERFAFTGGVGSLSLYGNSAVPTLYVALACPVLCTLGATYLCLVSRVGFEPTTDRLKGGCSTAELTARASLAPGLT
jgi:hypothetical protein